MSEEQPQFDWSRYKVKSKNDDDNDNDDDDGGGGGGGGSCGIDVGDLKLIDLFTC